MNENAELKTRLRAQAEGAVSLDIAFIGVVNGLFEALHAAGTAGPEAIADAAHVDRAYVRRWCDAAYAFGYLEEEADGFRLSATGAAMRPSAPDSAMPIAVQAVLGAHMAERAAGLMRSGARPGEQVLAERETILPWFGPMLEANYAGFFAATICPAVPVFREVDERGGLAVDLGCGNGWYLRALARSFPRLRGLGLDGFAENITQATAMAEAEGLGGRLRFAAGDIHSFRPSEPVDLIAMNRALHHVWEAGAETLFGFFRDTLRPGGAAVIWEPNWPAERASLRQPRRRGLAFQNLTEHVQGNHLLGAAEIVAAFERNGMAATTHLFADGQEAVIVARTPTA